MRTYVRMPFGQTRPCVGARRPLCDLVVGIRPPQVRHDKVETRRLSWVTSVVSYQIRPDVRKVRKSGTAVIQLDFSFCWAFSPRDDLPLRHLKAWSRVPCLRVRKRRPWLIEVIDPQHLGMEAHPSNCQQPIIGTTCVCKPALLGEQVRLLQLTVRMHEQEADPIFAPGDLAVLARGRQRARVDDRAVHELCGHPLPTGIPWRFGRLAVFDSAECWRLGRGSSCCRSGSSGSLGADARQARGPGRARGRSRSPACASRGRRTAHPCRAWCPSGATGRGGTRAGGASGRSRAAAPAGSRARH